MIELLLRRKYLELKSIEYLFFSSIKSRRNWLLEALQEEMQIENISCYGILFPE